MRRKRCARTPGFWLKRRNTGQNRRPQPYSKRQRGMIQTRLMGSDIFGASNYGLVGCCCRFARRFANWITLGGGFQTLLRFTACIFVLQAVEHQSAFERGLVTRLNILVLSRQLREFFPHGSTLGFGDGVRIGHSQIGIMKHSPRAGINSVST